MMPSLNPVPSLVQICLSDLAQSLLKICINTKVCLDEIKAEVVPYFSSLPSTFVKEVYRTFLNSYEERELYKGKYIGIGIYLGAEELRITKLSNLHLVVGKIDKKSVLENKIKYCNIGFLPVCVLNEIFYCEIYKPVCNIMKAFVNLITFTVNGYCTDDMLRILSRNCPLLEKIEVIACLSVTDTGISHLCGFDSEMEAKEILQWGNVTNNKSYCRNLKFVIIDTSATTYLSTALLLKYCKLLEVMDVSPQIDMGDVLNMIYGIDEDDYIFVTDKYNLKEFQSNFIIEESHLALFMRICPHMSTIKLRFSGRERSDKNLLANLVNSHITSLHVIDCHVAVLLWYLKDYGMNLTALSIDLMLSALDSAAISRTAIHKIFKYCSNLQQISLSVCGSPSIIPDEPIGSFNQPISLKHLESLTFKGISLTLDDLKIFLCCATNIKEIHIVCHALDFSVDFLINTFFISGKLKNLISFHICLPNPVLRIESLRNIISYCPLIREIGPLSLWNMSSVEYIDLKKEIKEKNWNLNFDKIHLPCQ